MKIMSVMDKIADIGKSTRDKQTEISVAEVWSLWDTLTERYDVIEDTNILLNFAQDPDLRAVLSEGLEKITAQAKSTESLMDKYGIPLPKQAPSKVTSTVKLDELTDEYIFRRVFRGMQGFIPIHANAFTMSSTPSVRQFFRDRLMTELDLYDRFLEYGKLKGWIMQPPSYRI